VAEGKTHLAVVGAFVDFADTSDAFTAAFVSVNTSSDNNFRDLTDWLKEKRKILLQIIPQ
jgi:hypothetical protein